MNIMKKPDTSMKNKDNGMDSIHDIVIDNTVVRIFIECGFAE